jgi:hypothetical protein
MPDSAERQLPHWNEDKPWSAMDLFDLHNHLEQGASFAETAEFLIRREEEVRVKAAELGIRAPAQRPR